MPPFPWGELVMLLVRLDSLVIQSPVGTKDGGCKGVEVLSQYLRLAVTRLILVLMLHSCSSAYC